MQVEGGHPWLQGIALAVLLCAFLRLERVERHGAVTALAVVVVAGLAAAVAAPRLDVGRPLLDPEALANALAPDRGLQFSWNHDYGALHWPRTGREVLRIKAKTASYWKVENLSHFDGLRWVAPPRARAPTEQEASMIASQRDWSSEIHVRVRGFSSRLFVGAGTTLAISSSPRTPIRNAPGTFRTGPRPLHEGQSYDAIVWNPRPTKRQLRGAQGRAAGVDVAVPAHRPPARPGRPGAAPAAGQRPDARRRPRRCRSRATRSTARRSSTRAGPGRRRVEVEDVLRRSAYGGVYRLAEQLRQGTKTPTGTCSGCSTTSRTAATRTPSSRRPAPSRSRRSCSATSRATASSSPGRWRSCCGWRASPPASRPASRPGTTDRDTGEFVVHDTDAHSWVEAYIAPYGWVTFDPTPPVGPARLNAGVGAAASAYALAAPAGVLGAGERVGDRNPGGGKVDDGSPLPLDPRRHRRARPRRDGRAARAPAPARAAAPGLRGRRAAARRWRGPAGPTTGGLTLQTMQRRYRGTPAEPYLRALEAARFGGSDVTPTPAMRSAMRRELVLGLGPAARLGAWRAIPPVLDPDQPATQHLP